MGPGRPPRRGPRAARARRRRARPYFINHPGAARTAQRGRHPRPDEPRDPHRPPGARRTSCRSPRPTTSCSAAVRSRRRRRSSRPASCVRTPGGLAWRGAGSPPATSRCARARPMPSRSSSPLPARLLGMLEQERAFSTVHEGAVYLHRGETYLTERSISTTASRSSRRSTGPGTRSRGARPRRASCARSSARPRCGVELQLRRRRGERPGGRLRAAQPAASSGVSTRIPLDLPVRQFATRALWFVPPTS